MPTQTNPDQFVNYKLVEIKLKTLSGVVEQQTNKVKGYRNARFLDIDIEAERQSKRLDEDAVFCPVHLINSNILREQPEFVAFVSQSPRAAVIKAKEDLAVDCQLVEKDFTDKVRYPKWMIPRLKVIDSLQQNGRGYLEVIHDKNRPGHFAVDYVAFEDLAFFGDTQDIQACELLLVKHRFTATLLRHFVKIGRFNQKAVSTILDEGQTETTSTSLYEIYKVYTRVKGTVHVAWACMAKLDGWLGDPRPLYLGRYEASEDPLVAEGAGFTPVMETSYPIFVYDYAITENRDLNSVKGRAFLDRSTQDAATTLLSSYTTTSVRASDFYWTKDSGMQVGNPDDQLKQTDVKFMAGKLIPANLKAFQLKSADPSVLGNVQALITQNLQEAGQVNYAANNRQDSRKTATEVATATKENSKLGSTKVYLFSVAENDLLNTCFEIYQSRVLAGQIIVPQAVHQHLATYTYYVKPAGDVDVIERAQRVQQMQQAWPVIAQTPASGLFLKKLLRMQFPEDADELSAELDEGEKAKQLVAALASLLKGALAPEELQGLPPEQIDNLLKTQAAVQQFLGQELEFVPPPPKLPKTKTSTISRGENGDMVVKTLETVQ